MERFVRLGATVLERTGGDLEVTGGFDAVVAGLVGARFKPSVTDARGREAEDVAEPEGDTTDMRVAVAEGTGFELVEEDSAGFAAEVAAGFAGATESLRFGGGCGAMVGFDGAGEALVDFLITGAAGAFAVVGFTTAGLTEPVPKVPESII